MSNADLMHISLIQISVKRRFNTNYCQRDFIQFRTKRRFNTNESQMQITLVSNADLNAELQISVKRRFNTN